MTLVCTSPYQLWLFAVTDSIAYETEGHCPDLVDTPGATGGSSASVSTQNHCRTRQA